MQHALTDSLGHSFGVGYFSLPRPEQFLNRLDCVHLTRYITERCACVKGRGMDIKQQGKSHSPALPAPRRMSPLLTLWLSQAQKQLVPRNASPGKDNYFPFFSLAFPNCWHFFSVVCPTLASRPHVQLASTRKPFVRLHFGALPGRGRGIRHGGIVFGTKWEFAPPYLQPCPPPQRQVLKCF